jgi:hypothetical protein
LAAAAPILGAAGRGAAATACPSCLNPEPNPPTPNPAKPKTRRCCCEGCAALLFSRKGSADTAKTDAGCCDCYCMTAPPPEPAPAGGEKKKVAAYKTEAFIAA